MKATDIEEKVLWTPTPDWVQTVDWMEKEQEPPEFSGRSLKYDKQVHAPKNTQYLSRVCRLSNYDDVQNNSVIQIELDPSYQRIHLHNLEVYRGKEKTKIIPRYKQKLIQKEDESHLYIFSNVWTLILIIEDLRVEDILDFSFSYVGINSFYENQILESFYLANTFPIKHVFCRIIAESDKLKFKNHNHLKKPVIHSLNEGFSEWIWDLYDQEPVSIEYTQPLWFEPCPWVQITSFSSWEEVSSAASSIFPTQIKQIPEISSKIEEWKAQSSSVEKLILNIIHFVKNEIRYLSLNEDMNIDQAANPNEVFFRRYGDCKDKTGLLCMLLNLIDIPAFPALVNTRFNHEIKNWLPSPYAFNHAITCFNFEENTYWVDPTDSLEVFKISQLPIPQFGYALPVGNSKSSLVLLEENPPGKVSTIVHFQLKKGRLETTMKISTSFHGIEAIYFRNFTKNKSRDEIKKIYTKYYKNFYNEILSKENIEISDDHEKNTIVLKECYEIPNFGTLNNEDRTITYLFGPFSLYEKLPKGIDLDRKSPIDLQYPVDIEEKIIIQLNDNIPTNVIDIPIENEYLAYNLKCYKQAKDTHVIFHSLKTLKNHIPVEDLEKMKSTLQEFYEKSGRELQVPRFRIRKKIRGSTIFWIIWILISLLRVLSLFKTQT